MVATIRFVNLRLYAVVPIAHFLLGCAGMSNQIETWRLVEVGKSEPLSSGFTWKLTFEHPEKATKREIELKAGTYELEGSGCKIFIDQPSRIQSGQIQGAAIRCRGFGVSTSCSSKERPEQLVTALSLRESGKEFVIMYLNCENGIEGPKRQFPKTANG